MSQMYGNDEPPEETNENVYEDYINHTASSGATRQDDAGKKILERKNREISSCNIVITTALILTFGLAACGMIFVVQNNNRIQNLMEELEVKIENLTTKVMRNHEEMVTMKDRISEIENEENLIRVDHKEYPIAVRLVGGNNSQGRVEVLHCGLWGTICDDNWGQEESNVVCHMLGFGNASRYYSNAHFGRGCGNIWLDEVQCTGIESDITYCRHKPWGDNDCSSSEDVSVVCDSVP